MNDKRVIKNYNLFFPMAFVYLLIRLVVYFVIGGNILSCIFQSVSSWFWLFLILHVFLLYPSGLFMKYELAEDRVSATNILSRKKKDIPIEENTQAYTFKVRGCLDVLVISNVPLSSKKEALEKRNTEKVMIFPTSTFKTNRILLPFFLKATKL